LATVPDGTDEHGYVEVRRWGVKPEFNYRPLQHFDVGEGLRLMDFEIAAKLSGARFVVLKGALAKFGAGGRCCPIRCSTLHDHRVWIFPNTSWRP